MGSSQLTEIAHALADQSLENGLEGGVNMPKGPHNQKMGPIGPVNANCILT